MTNLKRREAGLAPLHWNHELTLAARWFGQDSVEHEGGAVCGHTDSLGRSPGDRMVAYHYTNIGAWGENVICGYTTPERAVKGWMDSEEHKVNMLDPLYREIGVGYYRNAETGRGYITQDFSFDRDYAPVIIENEALTTTSTTVNLYIYDPAVGDGLEGMGPAVEMMIANDSEFTNAVWESFTAEKPWTLAEGAEGWRTVYVKTRDAQNRTAMVADTIYLGEQVAQEMPDMDQNGTLRQHFEFTNLDQSGWSKVQFSLNWQGDNSDGTFQPIDGAGAQVADADAFGGTSYSFPAGNTPNHSRYWTSTFYKDAPLVAYFRVKIADNQGDAPVLTIMIDGGGVQYGPLTLTGKDFTAAGQYQEFALPFTYHTNADQPFLTFDFLHTGAQTLAIDTISIFTAPVASTTTLQWEVPGDYYRSRGIWARFITKDGAFSERTEVNPFNSEVEVPPLPETQNPKQPEEPQEYAFQNFLPIAAK
ncbi:MAG: CAP domain-containing protein [Caldilineaceae bacterium]